MLFPALVGALLLSAPARAEGPLDAGRELLRSQAEAEDPRVRASAFAALIETEDDWSSWAAQGRHDEAPTVRRAALESGARRLPAPQAIGLLFEAMADPEVDNLSACMSALPIAAEPGLASQAASLAASLAASRVRSAHDQGDALPCLLLAALGGQEQAASSLTELLGSGRIRLDQALLLALARYPDPRIAPAIAQGQARFPEEARLSALLIRAIQGEAEAERELRATLRGEDEDAAMEAVDLLLELAVPGDNSLPMPRAAELLRQARRSSLDRVSSYADLTRLSQGEGAGRALREALADPNSELLDLALSCQARAPRSEALKERDERTVTRLLEAASLSERERIWIQAAGLAARYPEVEAEAALQTWTDSDEPLVQIAAARATLLRTQPSRPPTAGTTP